MALRESTHCVLDVTYATDDVIKTLVEPVGGCWRRPCSAGSRYWWEGRHNPPYRRGSGARVRGGHP